MSDIPESVYLEAATAYARHLDRRYSDEVVRRCTRDVAFRAAVDAAFRAGYGQGRDDEAAGEPVRWDAMRLPGSQSSEQAGA